MSTSAESGLNGLDFHVLLALVDAPLYGYAIRDAVESDSEGVHSPRAGTLYRVIARLMTWGFVEELDPPVNEEPHPGRTRRYYGLTPRGVEALREESRRLKLAAALAESRLTVR